MHTDPQRPERADAARNRLTILRAAEQLLAEGNPDRVSLDRVAERAGVGKGTVFRRFGSRTGLFQALLAERAIRLRTAIAAAAGPLGHGAPAPERLFAFLDELAELATRNVALVAAHERACAEDRYADPTYRHWHGHVRDLLDELRPGQDTEFLAHTLLGCFDGELVRHLLADGGPDRLRGNVRKLAESITGHTVSH
ncbi:TetR/AcrR family transcriptional regulator [Polymorphospora rubra]|uniref:TetR/AcrR family transcriptional regulator n=1 Tax=Polymorphospora rubra TaxID=338584 RepID=UPI00340B3538